MLCYILYMKDMGEVLEKELIDNLLNKQNSKEKLINVDDLKSKIKSKIETHCKHE